MVLHRLLFLCYHFIEETNMSYKRKQEEKKKIKKLLRVKGNGYLVPVYFDKSKGRYIILKTSDYRGKGTVAAIKRMGRKTVRAKLKKYPDIKFSGNQSNKLFDLWWTLY